jgi:uncharacterized protein YbjQ (UPF0145 family)
MKKSLLVMPIIFSLGCAVELTAEGTSVQLVDDKSSCEFLGTVTGYNSMGNSAAHDAEGAMNDLRNKAAEMGANAVKIIDVETTLEATTTIAEALYCTFN